MPITDHPDYQAHLAAVLAEPDDDLVRLTFADWLTERGDPRGEFIRVQIELDRLGTPIYEDGDAYDDGIRAKLRGREAELLGSDGCHFARPIAEAFGLIVEYGKHSAYKQWGHSGGVRGLKWEWRRGFIEAVTCTADDWLRHADAILAAAPVTTVTLTTWPDNWQWDGIRRTSAYHPDGRGRRWADTLAEEWPSIKFTLPPSARSGQLRIGNGEPIQIGNWTINREAMERAGEAFSRASEAVNEFTLEMRRNINGGLMFVDPDSRRHNSQTIRRRMMTDSVR